VPRSSCGPAAARTTCSASFRALTLAPGATDDGSDGLIADGPNVTATLDRVTIRPLSDQVRFPLWARNGSALVLRQSTMLPTGTVNIGVFLQDTGAEAEIERSDLRANGSVLRVSNTGGGVAHAFAHDSVLAGVSSAPGDPTTVPTVTAASFSAGDATVSLLGTTVASRRAQPEGINLVSSSVGGATVNARNTLVRATSTAGQAAPDVHVQPGHGPAAFAAANSSYDEAVVDPPVGGGTGTATAPGTEGNLAGDPGLVDEAGGNLRLNTSSPVVDRGDAGLVAPNELDLDDDPRTVDGDGDGDGVATPDIGAYERGLVPGVGGQGGPSTGTSGSGGAPASASAGASPGAAAADGPVRVLRFGLSRRRFAVGRTRTAVRAARPRRVATGTAFSFALSAPAAARIELARTVRRRGCRRGRRCTRLRPAGALTRNAGAGATTVPFSGRLGRRALKPGPYRATLVATGADGTRVPARALTFRVVGKRGG